MKKRLIAAALLALAFAAQASDRTVNIALEDVLAMPDAEGKLDPEVKFFLDGQKTPTVIKKFASSKTSKKTNAFAKSDDVACRWAALSALISLQNAVKQQGGNAMIDMVSNYNNIETKSSTTIECHAGGVMAGVALKGTVAKISTK